MKRSAFLLVAGNLLCVALTGPATTRYVDLNNPAPVAPYTNWLSAATNIQDAVDVAVAGDEILVTNGVYQTGARAVYGMNNRVAVTKAVTLQSVNGPAVTSIVGLGPIGESAVRCVYLTSGALLEGFTLTNGATQTSRDMYTNQSSGGVWCESLSAVVTNCVLAGNSAHYQGGGAYSGTLNHCTFTGNSAYSGGGASFSRLNDCTLSGNTALYGGGAWECTLDNCTLTGNSATLYGGGGTWKCTLNNCTLTGNSATLYGGGAKSSTLNNCVVYYNTSASGPNYFQSALNYCCTTPLPAEGAGNTDVEPQLASASHLSANSPCIGRGSAAYAAGVDIDGEPWATPPSVGCDEYWSGSVTGALSVGIVAAYTNVAVGLSVDFAAMIGGRVSSSRWDFGDGMVVSNRPFASHAWGAAGDFRVELRAYNESYPGGVAAELWVRVVNSSVLYVSLNGTNPVPPYRSWATAATNIQDAVDLAAAWDEIVVTNGVYEAGARAVYGRSNRVVVAKPVTVRSVSGPAVTSIVGYQVPGTTNGPTAVRCVYLTNGAVLAGFTLTNGATEASGGGVWCESMSAVVSNCVLAGNYAVLGGGSYQGTLNNCVLAGNSADRGGGVYYGALNNCILSGNSASWFGGGVYDCVLNNCTLTGNSANKDGGGATYSTLRNCTLTGNSASNGGGAAYSTLDNCIVYYNRARLFGANFYGATLSYCCATQRTYGPGNFTNAPLFVDTNGWSNLRLQADSPCINAGANAYAPGLTDLDGNPRIAGGRVDVGAYEFQGAGLSGFTAWLWQYGLRIDGSADYVDSDGDGHNNWQEWVAGTNPTNALSALRMLSASGAVSGVTVTWSSVSYRSYTLERASDLGGAPAFSVLQSNIAGWPETTSWTDTNGVGGAARFYRVRVEQ